MIGVLMLSISLLLSGTLGLLQEITYKKYGPCWREGVFYTVTLSQTFILRINSLKICWDAASTLATNVHVPHQRYT